MKETRTDYPTDMERRHQRFAHQPKAQGQPKPTQPHPIYGNATAEDVALKLRRNVAKPVRRRTK